MPASRQPQPTVAQSNSDLATSISTFLSSKNMAPNQTWMQSFMPSVRASTPLVALQKTALFRLLAADFTTSVVSKSTSTLPAGITDPGVKELRLPGPIPVQVLDVEDIGHSRWSQVETLEAQESGEFTKGREVIRVLPDEADAISTAATQAADPESKSAGPHKVLLQDAHGTKVYAIELRDVSGVNTGMAIGAKLVLTDVVVARGVVMLEPRCVEVLGGKVEAWDKKWRLERKAVLKQKAGMNET